VDPDLRSHPRVTSRHSAGTGEPFKLGELSLRVGMGGDGGGVGGGGWVWGGGDLARAPLHLWSRGDRPSPIGQSHPDAILRGYRREGRGEIGTCLWS